MALHDWFRYERNFNRYRLSLLIIILRVFVVPCLFAQAALSLSLAPRVPALLKWLLIYPLSISMYWAVLNSLQTWRNNRDAARRGLQLIPKVYGRWPGGLDLMMHFAHEFENGYGTLEFRKYFEERGVTTLNFQVMFHDVIMTIDHVHIHHILATGFNYFEKGEHGRYIMEGVFGNGIFNRDGDVWKMHRAMTRPFFSRDRISDYVTIGKHTEASLRVLLDLSHRGSAVDVQDLFARFTIDAAAEFLFGAQLNSIHARLPQPGRSKLGPKGSKADSADDFGSFVQAFDEAQVRMSKRFHTDPFWRVSELYEDALKDPMAIVRGYLEPVVQRALDEHAAAKRKGVKLDQDDCTLLQYLVANTDDKTVLRDELVNILIAGRDTTAALLTFTIYILATHPDVFRQLRQEVLAICGPDMPPTYETVRDMKYLRAVLNESLRLFPPVPINQRFCGTEPAAFPSSTPGGASLYVPAQTDIIYIPLLLHRRKDLWGPDAEEFNPERWIDQERLAKFVQNPTIFVPFNAGPRICLGQQFAYNEASFFLARLLQKFSAIELAPEAAPSGAKPPREWENKPGRQGIEKCWPKAAVILFVKGGLWVRFTPVEGA